MRTRLATAALLGTLSLTGVAGAALLAPAVSYAATGTTTAGPVGWVTDALAGLVSDGSITQAQADEVATTLQSARPEGGPGGFGGGGHRGSGRVDLAAAATALGLTEDELQTRTQAGETLADIADAEGVDQAEVVDALVAAEQARLAQAVTDGRLTQAQADERAATLEERVTAQLDELCGPGGGGRGPGGPRGEAPAPDASQAPSSDTSTATT
ncbi:MAG: hypothetical protein JWN08_438, partial [Frankiales bacterium]|nr:hypothetical protein [Frankiales bacterium]